MLVPALEEDARKPDSSHDFGKDIIPGDDRRRPVYAYRFYDENKKAGKYWRDIGTLDAYYEANMDLCHVNPEFNLYDPEWPLRTYQVQAPPAKFVFADEDGGAAGARLDHLAGCIISGSRVSRQRALPNVRVHSFCDVDQSILMPGVRVGRHARIRRAIIDRDVFIPRGALIGYNREEGPPPAHRQRRRRRRRDTRRRAVRGGCRDRCARARKPWPIERARGDCRRRFAGEDRQRARTRDSRFTRQSHG